MMLRITSIIFAFLLLPVSWQVAHAQAPMGVYDYYIMRQQIVNQAMLNQAMRRRGAAGKTTTGRNAAGKGAQQSTYGSQVTVTMFRPAANSIVPQQLAATSTSNPREAQERQAFFEECLRSKEEVIAKTRWQRRMAVKDVADALSTFIADVYYVHSGASVTWQQLLNMSEQISEIPSVRAKFQKMPDREKQQVYETVSILGEVLSRSYDEAKTTGDRQALRQYQQKANELLEKMLGIPGNRLKITDQGFIDGGKQANDESKTTFKRSATIESAPNYAYKYKVSESLIARLLEEFDGEVVRRGGKTNDAAWVNAIAFDFIYEVYTDGKVKLNQQQLNWVLREMQDDIAADSGFQASSNDRKQLYYEQVAIEPMMIVYQYRKEGLSSKVKAAAREKLQEIFAPRKIEEYTLTPNGFDRTLYTGQ